MNARSYCAEYYLLSDTKKTLVKSVLIDLRARYFVHAKISLRARSSPCAQFVEPCNENEYQENFTKS